MGKFFQCTCIQSYGPSFMTKFCSALYLENLLTNIFAKLNLRGGVSCMPAALLLPLGTTPKTVVGFIAKNNHWLLVYRMMVKLIIINYSILNYWQIS